MIAGGERSGKNLEGSAADEEIIRVRYLIEKTKERKHKAQQRRSLLVRETHSSRLLRDALMCQVNLMAAEEVEIDEQLRSLSAECDRVLQNLEKSMKINPLSDVFHIWHSGPFGTINGCRMGSLPSKQIEWTEINAALGQAVLAVCMLAQKMGHEFKKYKLYPIGSTPRVAKVSDPRNMLLLYTDDASFSFFPKRNFNAAMSGFLECVNELGEYTKRLDPTLAFPYAINAAEGKVLDQVITLGTDDEMWTRAMKFLLADIKWLIAWATRHCNDQGLSKPLPKLVS